MALHKQHTHFGRSRTTPRHERRVPAAVEGVRDRFFAALRAARRYVESRWPELADVEPAATSPLAGRPNAELLERLGLANSEIVLRTPDEVEYTFTFAGETATGDGHHAPLVAAVTVNEHRQIVNVAVSR